MLKYYTKRYGIWIPQKRISRKISRSVSFPIYKIATKPKFYNINKFNRVYSNYDDDDKDLYIYKFIHISSNLTVILNLT